MRKLKKFTLAEGHALSSSEMAMLEGGDFISFYCYYEYAPCAILYPTGISTGTCHWGYTPDEEHPDLYRYKLYCLAN